jgi:hypothetical protein
MEGSKMHGRFMPVLALVLTAGCVHVLPPPPEPERVVPASYAPAPPAPQGTSPLILDTPAEPATVEEVTGHYEGTDSRGHSMEGSTYRNVCASTPCAANLELGQHVLRFTSLVDPLNGGTGVVLAGPRPSAYRYAMGHGDPGKAMVGLVTTSLGVAAASAGFAFFLSGTMTDSITHQQSSPGEASAGTGLMVGGGVLAVAGAVMAFLWGPRVQNGTGVQWDLP